MIASVSDAAARKAAAGLTHAQRNAVRAGSVLLPAYRDGGRMHRDLMALGLAKAVLGGLALTQLGRRVRIELMEKRR